MILIVSRNHGAMGLDADALPFWFMDWIQARTVDAVGSPSPEAWCSASDLRETKLSSTVWFCGIEGYGAGFEVGRTKNENIREKRG